MKKLTHKQIVEVSSQKLSNSEYIISDISDEAWREIELPLGTYHIDNPVTLIIRKGGKTHRVVDANGVVHCYVAPESGKSVIRWKTKSGAPVTF